jgi:hypothetical protein
VWPQRIADNSCANRHCPQCPSLKRADWIRARTDELLDVLPSDGFLSVVTAGEEHRGALRPYLEDRIAGRTRQLSLPTRLARTVEIDGCGILHLDDDTQRAAELGPLSLRIRPAALHILTPAL